MSLGRKTIVFGGLALAGLAYVLYAALASILWNNNAQEELMVSYLAVSVVVTGGGFFLVTLLLMNKLVLSRLEHLQTTIRSIGASGDFSQRLEIDGRDELAGIALEINNLLRVAQEAQESVHGGLKPAHQGNGTHTNGEVSGREGADAQRGSKIVFLRGSEGAGQMGPGEIFQAIPIALALCEAETGRIRDANGVFLDLVGRSREEAVGRSFDELELWADPAMRQQWNGLLGQPRSVRDAEGRLRTKAGEFRDTLVSADSVRVGERQCFLFGVCDITDRLTKEVQLRQTHKMEAVGQMAAGFAHDFNNILAIVQGYSSLLLADQRLDPSAHKALKEVSAATERAANLTRQLLIFSRKQFMQPKTLDLNRLLQGMENTLQRVLGESTAVKFKLSPDGPFVRADSAMMEQALVNLAVNAHESMPRGGQLEVSTQIVEIDAGYVRRKPEARTGAFTCLTVSDTGSGFDPANLNRLFEPFFSAKGNGKGMGLGLATVYGIMKQHNGWIEVASQPGQGTTFKLFFPNEPKPAAAAKAPLPGVAGGTEHILLVEDEAGLCVMVEGILRRYGYKVITAPNGVEAMQLWKQHQGQFDLLLTDMVMPEGLTGRQLAEKLRALSPGLKVVYSSGYSVDLVNGEGLELSEGLNFLQKPYHPQKLAQTVRSCLDAPVVDTECVMA